MSTTVPVGKFVPGVSWPKAHRHRVLVLVAGLHVRVLTEDGELLRNLTLDPSRDYQALGRP